MDGLALAARSAGLIMQENDQPVVSGWLSRALRSGTQIAVEMTAC